MFICVRGNSSINIFAFSIHVSHASFIPPLVAKSYAPCICYARTFSVLLSISKSFQNRVSHILLGSQGYHYTSIGVGNSGSCFKHPYEDERGQEEKVINSLKEPRTAGIPYPGFVWSESTRTNDVNMSSMSVRNELTPV